MGELLKLVLCGSVDDGKSTLIGRLLADAGLLFSDEAAALASESRASRPEGGTDYSLLLDGLLAEREQGITIDVAYRSFSTKKRRFLAADAPGHEEYTRNMAVGASFADLAVLLADASRGVLAQTQRHLRICALMGIRHFVFAVNKMDLVGFDEKIFRSIEKELAALAAPFAPASLSAIPVCAIRGGNVVHRSGEMPWYAGPSLLSYLEEIPLPRVEEDGLVVPVQRVSRAPDSTRWYQGQLACGNLQTGDRVTILPGGTSSRVTGLLCAGAEATDAQAGAAVSLRLEDEVECARGSVLARDTTLLCGNHFSCDVLWMDDAPLVSGGRYRIKLATQQTGALVHRICFETDIATGAQRPAHALAKNALGRVELSCTGALVFDRFDRHRALGRFLLINALTGQTAGCGVIRGQIDVARNLVWQETDLSRARRASLLGQQPKTLWFTGLPGSGKTSLANALEVQLSGQGYHTMLLDGDNVRMGLGRDLDFSSCGRAENIRRVAEVAKLMNDAGLIVLAAFVSPLAADREAARQIIGPENFVEIYVSTPLAECERRDVKGHYRRAKSGELPGFTGVDGPYEVPAGADITVDTTGKKPEEAAAKVLKELKDFD